jgi:hypothetical protein
MDIFYRGLNIVVVVMAISYAAAATYVTYVLVTRTDNYNTVTQWEHGFKTNRVVATRYQNSTIGFNIGFRFPKDPNNSDRAEISNFMAAHGGTVFQSGRSGAEMFVQFSDVTDRDTADQKLQAILPDLNELMTDMADGKGIRIGSGQTVSIEALAVKDNSIKDRPGQTSTGFSINDALSHTITYEVYVYPGRDEPTDTPVKTYPTLPPWNP